MGMWTGSQFQLVTQISHVHGSAYVVAPGLSPRVAVARC
jgi:hypothetical protein